MTSFASFDMTDERYQLGEHSAISTPFYFSEQPPMYEAASCSASTAGSTMNTPPIDPDLQNSAFLSMFPMPWSGGQTHPMLQNMKDPLPVSYFMSPNDGYDLFPQFQPQMTAHTAMLHERHNSPSSHLFSPAGSESLGSPPESHTLPQTPEDTSTFPPFMPTDKPAALWSAQSHALGGVGSFQENPYVSPSEVNPSQDVATRQSSLEADTREEHNLGFSGPHVTMDPSCAESFSASSQLQLQDAAENVESGPSSNLLGGSQSPVSYPELDGAAPAAGADRAALGHEARDKGRKPTSPRKRSRAEMSESPSVSKRTPNRQGRKRAKLEGPSSSAKTSAGTKQAAPQHATSKPGFSCDNCKTTPFRDEASLEKHVKSKHTRPFTCVFHFAGCPSSFPNKNEWKRHVLTQHLAYSYWVCTQDSCGRGASPHPRSKTSSAGDHLLPSLGPGAIFNRKDLYTQHVRRMHVPVAIYNSSTKKKPTPEWDDRLRQLQADAEKHRCMLPDRMSCPVPTCRMEFTTPNAWDERMEHVARHLEAAAEGSEAPVRFGGDTDPSLTNWAETREVGVLRRTPSGGWELLDPLRGEVAFVNSIGHGRKRGRAAAAAATTTTTTMTLSSSPTLEEIKVELADDVDADGEDD